MTSNKAGRSPAKPMAWPAWIVCLAPLALVHAAAAEDSAAPRAANGVSASRAAIDPDTKRLRAPEADEIAPAAAGAASRAAAPQSVIRSANAQRFRQQQLFGKEGAETMRLDLQKSLRFTVARRDAEGRLQKDCVIGEDAVAQRLAAAAGSTREARHE